jgi:hypothetical protein
VVSTSGWGFWVLDDLSALQQMDGLPEDEGAVQDIHLFQNRAAYRAVGLGGGGGGSTGENPPNGAIIDFYLGSAPLGEVKLDILSGDGEVVRSFSTEAEEEEGEEELEVGVGMNRLVWDLRYPEVFRVPGLYAFGSLQGRRVVPGTYTARLSKTDADGGLSEATAPIRVLKDPRMETTQDSYLEQDALLREIVAETEALHRSVVRLGKVREQIEAVLDRAAEMDGTEELQDLGGALVDSLTMVEDSLVQRKTYDGQTVLNAPSRINFQYIYLMGSVEGSDDGVNAGARDVLRDLNARWHPLRDRLDLLLRRRVDTFNDAVRKQGIPPVGIGGERPEAEESGSLIESGR